MLQLALLLSLAWGAGPALWSSFTAAAGPSTVTLRLAVCDPKAAARAAALRPHVAVNGQYIDPQLFAESLAALHSSLLSFRKHREFVPAAADYLVHIQCPAGGVDFSLQGSGLQAHFEQLPQVAALLQAACTKLLHAAGVSAGLKVKPATQQNKPLRSPQHSPKLRPRSRAGHKRASGAATPTSHPCMLRCPMQEAPGGPHHARSLQTCIPNHQPSRHTERGRH